MDLRTFYAQLWVKAVIFREEDLENKILSFTGEKVKIIESIFLFFLTAGWVCTGKPVAML